VLVRFALEFETPVAPDRILAAMTDFSERRLALWPALAPSLYEVHSVGRATADVTEGSTKPFKVWARERYDWSQPGVVRWEVVESNFSHPGHGHRLRVEPSGTGSFVRLDYDRDVFGVKGFLGGVAMRLAGKGIMRGYFTRTFARWP